MNKEKRINEIQEIINKINESGVVLPDIRNREWLKLNVPAAKILQSILEAENYLIELDDYQMEHGQIYPKIEDMMLQIGQLRNDYTKYIDEHEELLFIKDEDLTD